VVLIRKSPPNYGPEINPPISQCFIIILINMSALLQGPQPFSAHTAGQRGQRHRRDVAAGATSSHKKPNEDEISSNRNIRAEGDINDR